MSSFCLHASLETLALLGISVAQTYTGKIFLLKHAAPQGCPCSTWQEDYVVKKLKRSEHV